ncbi:MAG: ATP synthase F0 subunit B [Pyrinomonadaceae bacterium]
MIYQALNHTALLFAPEAGGWLSVPGLEVWRFINLAIFLGVIYYLVRRPLSEAFKVRREGIRKDLMRAQEERDAAMAKLAEVERRIAHLGDEVEVLRLEAQKEAAEERDRIRKSTEDEIRRLREQSRLEIEMAGKTARYELRQFAAERSVEMAEDMLRRELKPEDDARLVSEYVKELRGVRA